MSPPNVLPSRPNLEHLKDQADDLRRAYVRRDPDAISRVAAVHLDPSVDAAATGPETPDLPQARALLVVAREYGYPSWPALKAFVENKETTMKTLTPADRRELYTFSLRLASFLRIGVPILDGLEACAQAAKDPEFAKAVRDIRAKLKEGESLAARMLEHPRWFKSVYVQMIAAGQETGQLDVMVEKLAAYLESDEPTSVMAAFARQLATMVGAGLPLVQSLAIISEQADDAALVAALRAVVDDLKGGAAFAEALAKHPAVFDATFVFMAKAGDISGALDKALDRLATDLERQDAYGRKAKSA
ncbi:MAG: type II secretion system F family protein [Candidatus Coatesbacteria bacterium]